MEVVFGGYFFSLNLTVKIETFRCECSVFGADNDLLTEKKFHLRCHHNKLFSFFFAFAFAVYF